MCDAYRPRVDFQAFTLSQTEYRGSIFPYRLIFWIITATEIGLESQTDKFNELLHSSD